MRTTNNRKNKKKNRRGNLKKINNSQANALLRLRTYVNAVTVNAGLNIPTVYEQDGDSLNFVPSNFVTDYQLLISQVEGFIDVAILSINVTTMVRENLYDLRCRQIQERLRIGQFLRFQL